MGRIGISLLGAALLAGCSGFGETHHFRAVDRNGQTTNYFRLQVSGWTALSSSRYLSGYFDEAAVDAYFNEMAQPEKGALRPSPPAPGGERIAPLDGAREGTKLVMILSTDSDAIAEQIGGLAENREVAQALSRLVYRGKFEDAAEAEAEGNVQAAKGKLLAAVGDKVLEGLKTAPNEAASGALLLEFLNAVAASEGNSNPFRSADDARRWFDVARARFLKD